MLEEEIKKMIKKMEELLNENIDVKNELWFKHLLEAHDNLFTSLEILKLVIYDWVRADISNKPYKAGEWYESQVKTRNRKDILIRSKLITENHKFYDTEIEDKKLHPERFRRRF